MVSSLMMVMRKATTLATNTPVMSLSFQMDLASLYMAMDADAYPMLVKGVVSEDGMGQQVRFTSLSVSISPIETVCIYVCMIYVDRSSLLVVNEICGSKIFPMHIQTMIFQIDLFVYIYLLCSCLHIYIHDYLCWREI